RRPGRPGGWRASRWPSSRARLVSIAHRPRRSTKVARQRLLPYAKYQRRDTLPAPRQLRMAIAVHGVIVHHAGGLHERVADRRSHEAKSAPHEIARHRLRLRGLRRHVARPAPAVLEGRASDEGPQIAIEVPDVPREREDG